MGVPQSKERLHDWRKALALGAVALTALIVMAGLSACSIPSRNASNPDRTESTAMNSPLSKTAVERVPTSLSNAGEFGENIYDYVKGNDWKNADAKLAALRDASKNVRSDIKDQSAAVDRFDANVMALERAVIAKDRQAAMREANQVTFDVANMTTAYRLSVPVEVAKLDYYGRELEVWAQARDATKLQATARQMGKTWNSLRPSVAAYDATEAKKFDALVAQVKSAKTPADYARVATPVLDEVDKLEGLFP